MNRITQLDPAQATGKTRQLFDGVQVKLGTVPNLFRVLVNSPAALEGCLNPGAALVGGSVIVLRCEVNDAELKAARSVGLGEGEIVEIVANVGLNIFSNHINHIARMVMDFPEVKHGNGHLVTACACD